MIETSFKNKLFLSIFGILVFLFLIEAGMRLSGSIIMYQQNQRNKAALEKKDSYRILCLGESTTALGGENSYPRQLETILNEKFPQKTFSIINKGKAAIRSKDIVRLAPEFLKQYQPDMVIVMMGINDMIYTKVDVVQKDANRLYTALASLKFYKLFKTIVQGLRLKEKKKEMEFLPVGNNYMLKTMMDIPPDQQIAYRKSWTNIVHAEKYMLKDNWKEAKKHYWEAIHHYPYFISHYMCLVNRQIEQGEFDQSEEVYKYAIEYNPNVVWGYAGLRYLYQKQGRNALAREYELKVKEVESRYHDWVVKDAYRKIEELLDSHNIKMVSVQYPLRNVQSLKKMFDDTSGILFVDNEINFYNAIKRDGYDVYFKDNFAGDFGHCTDKGNRLLAENVAREILNYVQVH